MLSGKTIICVFLNSFWSKFVLLKFRFYTIYISLFLQNMIEIKLGVQFFLLLFRKTNDLIKRTRSVRIHVLLINYIRNKFNFKKLQHINFDYINLILIKNFINNCIISWFIQLTSWFECVKEWILTMQKADAFNWKNKAKRCHI